MSDYIKREAATLKLCNMLDYVRTNEGPFDPLNCLLQVGDMLIALPAEDVEPVRHGHWIDVDKEKYLDGADFEKCSECGYEQYKKFRSYVYGRNYCPNCGTKMDGKGQEHD